jgi:hypothetical protein
MPAGPSVVATELAAMLLEPGGPRRKDEAQGERDILKGLHIHTEKINPQQECPSQSARTIA